MSGWEVDAGIVLAGVVAGAAAGLLWPVPSRPVPVRSPRSSMDRAASGWMMRWRPWWSLLSGAGAGLFVGGPAGLVVAALAAAGCWIAIGRAEPPEVRRRRESVRRDLPALVRLLGSALASGASPAQALELVTYALPGAAAEQLAPVAARLRLGADPVTTWRALESDPTLAPLGRTLARSHAAGTSVVTGVDRLAEELARQGRTEVEDRARAVGVKAAVPLGLCLLPAFLLIGVVPVVGGLLGELLR